jgi:hypothetical protein
MTRRRPAQDERVEGGASARLGTPSRFKITQRLEPGWRPLNGGLTLMTLLLRSARFGDGVDVPADVSSADKVVPAARGTGFRLTSDQAGVA